MDSRDRFNFSVLWFEDNIENWTKLFGHLRRKKIRVLEIGAFEGASTTWILENLFDNPASQLITVDTFRGSIEHMSRQRLSDLEKRFYDNVRKTGKSNQLTVLKSKSFDALIRLNAEHTDTFNLIYIDGSHLSRDVISDAALSWPLLAEGGFMVFDDYAWDYYKEPHNNPRLAIDAFIASHAQDMRVVHRYYQAILRKVKREDTFTIANTDRTID